MPGKRKTNGLSAAEEGERRLARAKFKLVNLLFAKQLAVANDVQRFRALHTSRQAGKTSTDIHLLIDNAVNTNPGTDSVFIAITRDAARSLAWRELKELNEKYHLGGIPHEIYLTLTFPNKSTIQLRGVQDRSDLEFFRGRKFSLIIIDEAQSIGAHLRDLIFDVLRPTLFRFGGRMILSGTTPMLAAGIWAEILLGKHPEWSVHRWLITDNPWIPNAAEEMASFARALGGEHHPRYRREMLAEFVTDTSTLVYPFDPARDVYRVLPARGRKPDGCVFGVDIGITDASAIAVLVWWDDDPNLYLAEEWVQTGVDLDALAAAIRDCLNRWTPDKIVCDEGGLGKMIAESLRRQPRWGLDIEHAVKTADGGLVGQIHGMSTDLIRGRLKVKEDSRAAADFAVVSWDLEQKKLGVLKVCRFPHSDIIDALRYAWFVAQRYHLWEPPAPKLSEIEERRARIRKEIQEHELRAQEEGDQTERDLADLGYNGE